MVDPTGNERMPSVAAAVVKEDEVTGVSGSDYHGGNDDEVLGEVAKGLKPTRTILQGNLGWGRGRRRFSRRQ